MLDHQLGTGPIQLREGLERGGHGVAAGDPRGCGVDFDELDVLAGPPLGEVGERLAQLLHERERDLAPVLVRAGEAEVRVLPHVLHGAGDDGDGVAAPVLGQVAGQPDAVGGVREVAGEGQLGALDPRLLAEQVVVGFLGFAPLGQ